MAKIKTKQILATSSLDMSTQNIVNVADPLNPQDAATKAYVDAKVQGLDPKESVKAATTATLGTWPISGPQTVDNVALVAGNRVLVKNETAGQAKYNGIWVVSNTAWTRAEDANTWEKLVSAFTFVEKGDTNKDTGWVCTIDAGTGTIDVDPVSWTQFSGAGSYTADEGNGIHLNGTIFELALSGDSISKSGGLKSAVQYEQQALVSEATASPAVDHFTGLTLDGAPAGDCDIVVTINGVKEKISYGAKTGSVYYAAAGTGGAVAKAKAALIATDELWFSPANAGYELELTDEISQIYSKIN